MKNVDLRDQTYHLKTKEINLKELYAVLKRRMWVVFAMAVIGALAGGFYSYTTHIPLYQTSSRIIISADPDYRTTLQVIIKDPTVLEKVVEQLGLQTTPEALANKIDVESIDSSQVVSIVVTDNNPNRAAQIANTTATIFKNEIPNIVGFNKVALLSPAKVNPSPINQNQYRIILIALAAGIFLGVGLVFLLESLDETVKAETEIELVLGLPILGEISRMSKKNIKKKIIKPMYSRGGTIGL
ncbi:YveK family protein [Heyndrickxia acidicola]|uniref:Wzz/FepE/Etk N-terminal domain-containing protein n=1 Tax=Heyndrickxia acidicola TaxID=209389 RepID=A0ABU6MKI1_9BACI|nr:Wzz/FepE/Etk N-terminal domain-containing protein [Heyndrickxia acidicola]MED1205189.1 Wzz/FepE/Etk N-terminal domain-containing protein [Heyndrickxia acidicola]